MDRILELLDRNHHWVLIVLGMILGTFIVSLVMAHDWATAAGALGNLIGAAIGAAGAAGAVVWQLNRQTRERQAGIVALRIAAFRSVVGDLSRWLYHMESASKHLIINEPRSAAREFVGLPANLSAIDHGLEEQLRVQSPIDLDLRSDLAGMVKRVSTLAWNIQAAKADTDQDQNDLAAAIVDLADDISDFARAVLSGHRRSATMLEDATAIVSELSGAGLPRNALSWMFRPQTISRLP
jgi:hypothetical protein